jgi:tRNA(Ile)-lysidine synthase
MSDLQPFECRLAREWPRAAWADVAIVLAVSGGADSMALLRAILAIRHGGPGRVVVAHFNHGLRGLESDVDQAFVASVCRQLDVPCEIGGGSLAVVGDLSDGIEAAARAARYSFLKSTAERLGARYVVTAHTADDQAETILHRIVRGTGLAGLAGMRRARPLGDAVSLLRPMLAFHRGENEAYLESIGQSWRHDSSNRDTTLTRNRLRRILLPELAAGYNSNVVAALLRLGQLAGEAQSVMDSLVGPMEDRYVRDTADGLCFDAARLAGEPRYLIRELLLASWRRMQWPLQAMGFVHWDELADMVMATASPSSGSVAVPSAQRTPALPRAKRMFPGGVTAEIEGDLLKIGRSPAAEASHG